MKVVFIPLLVLTVLVITADAWKLRDEHHYRSRKHEKRDRVMFHKHPFVVQKRVHEAHGSNHHHVKLQPSLASHRLQSHLLVYNENNQNIMDPKEEKDFQNLNNAGLQQIHYRNSRHHQHHKMKPSSELVMPSEPRHDLLHLKRKHQSNSRGRGKHHQKQEHTNKGYRYHLSNQRYNNKQHGSHSSNTEHAHYPSVVDRHSPHYASLRMARGTWKKHSG
ncbi:uncharacterized protein LOC143248731 [Tachypleus tridentatus]|uniref:uncharacterized protein LOC143248731 n=1 Tax=Tachypleus tridentatus TaxID=6853 RepID=UPI003FCF786B